MATYTSVFDENKARDMVVAANEDNNLVDTEFAQDIRNAPFSFLERKYGLEVAENRRLYGEQRVEADRIENDERSALQVAGDTTAGVAAGLVGTVSSVVGAGIGAVGAVDEYFDPENTAISDYATRYVAAGDELSGAIRGLQSEELEARQGLSGVEARLDADDNLAQYNRETSDGDDASFVDNLAWMGRGTLNNAGRVLTDGSIAADVIAQGIGSLGPSAKIASVASGIVTGSRTFNAAKVAHAVAPTQGTRFLSAGADAVQRSAIALSVGGTEAAGVYSQTVNEVLGMTHGALLDGSPEYSALIDAGVTEDDAKAQIASHAGMDAFGNQFPQAVALGLITARFEAAPIANFRGSGLMGGLRTVGAQTLEEGGQGATGQISTNAAIRDIADSSRPLMEGVPQAFAEGAIAGAGMAGVLAAPAAIGNTPRAVVDGARDLANTDTARRLAAAGASVAATGLDAVQAGATAVAKTRAGAAAISGAADAASKALEVAAPVAAAASDAISDVNNRPDRGIQSENLEIAASIQQLSDAELRTPIPDDAEPEAAIALKTAVQSIVREPTSGPVPQTFAENVSEGGTVLQNVTGILTTMATKDFKARKMSDSDAIYASEQFTALRNSSSALPVAIRNKVKKVLTSPDFKSIQKRVASIDLNATQTPTTAVTADSTAETIAVASTNPANVNPEFTNKVLEQGDLTDVSPEKIQVMKGSVKVANAINTHIGDSVEFTVQENVKLQTIADTRGDKAKLTKVPLIKAISRNLTVGGLKDGRGKGLRSIAEFARDIFQGAQTADGKFVNADGVIVPVAKVIEQYGMFSQHMINKVGALNESYDNRDANGRGSSVRFESLSQGRQMVPATSAAAGAPMTYQSGSPGGVSFAQQVHADATVAVEVYNAMAETFPDQFPGGLLSVPELRGFDSQSEQPTAVEEEVSNAVDASDEQPPAVATMDPAKISKLTDARLNQILNNLMDKREAGTLNEVGVLNLEIVEADMTRREDEANDAAALEDEQNNDEPVTDPEVSDAVKLAEDEVRTNEQFDALTDEQRLASVNEWDPDTQFSVMSETDQTTVLDAIGPRLAEFDLPDATVQALYVLDGEGNAGRATWGERAIGLTTNVIARIKQGLWLDGEHIAYHEVMHVIDAYAENDVKRTASMGNGEFDAADGKIYAEVKALVETNEKMKEYFSYALSFSASEDVASELFAEIGALYMLDAAQAKEILPEGVKYVEKIIQQAGGTIPANGEETSNASDTATVPEELSEGVGINAKEFNLPEQFAKSFIPDDSEMTYSHGEDILSLVQKEEGTENYVEFVQLHLQNLMDAANQRLVDTKTTSTDKQSIFERIQNGEDTTTYRRNKNTMFVGPDGKYDPDLLSIASVAVLDWLTSARSNNPANLKDTMEDMGVEFSDLTKADIESIMFGVPPRDTSEQLAKAVARMWGMKVSKDEAMVDGRGAIEGLVKELLVSLVSLDAGMTIEMVPFFDIESNKMVEQAVFNVRGMAEMQQAIGLTGQGAVTKMLAPELVAMPSIGEPVGEVDQTQSRGDVPLSTMERRALKAMQDTPHIIADELSSMVSLIGFEALAPYLGQESTELLGDKHPLKASKEGKNLSVQRDFDEAMMVVKAIRDASADTDSAMPSVFYRIGISKVGRHQFKGINPQNNKILRALVTPTHALLDMTSKKHKDNFWLTVAQGSGINKVENNNHKTILQDIQSKFDEEFGEATALVLAYLNGAEIDGAAVTAAMGGTGDMQQLSTVFAVASLQKAMADGTEAAFNTSLSFELDGKTDGPGNMMVNFGQGVMDALEFTNFKRVGFFLGTTAMTLNKFFGDGTQDDLYEITAKRAMADLNNRIAQSVGQEKERLHAMRRFAAAFGDFKFENGEFSMTRTTAKNPMTKTVYGSSERGVGSGLASEMAMEMYAQLIDQSGVISEYPGGHVKFVADFELVFKSSFPSNTDWNKSFLEPKSMKDFTKLTTETLGQVLSETAKSVIGDNITEVNDNLVLMTGFQTEFLTAKFEQLLDAKVTALVADGTMHVLQSGKPNMTTMPQRAYDEVVAEIKTYSPTYANGMQTLDIGSLSPTDSGIRLSSTMDEKLNMNSSMISPELAGVKAIPYITQGRGDAMMMNRIYGGENAPTGTLNVFDGIDMAIDKIGDYAQTINESVMENWDADVLADVVNDFTGFFDKTANDGNLLIGAWNRAFEAAKKKRSTTKVTTPEGLISTMLEMQRLNQARKTVFRNIGVSVDHMGGSDSAFVRGNGDREYSMGEINNMIREELGLIQASTVQENDDGSIEGEATDVTPQDVPQLEAPVEGQFSKLVVTTPEALMEGLLRETKNKIVQKSARILSKVVPSGTRVVIGSAEEVTAWYTENVGDMDKTLTSQKGIYDPANNVMLITENIPETLIHEMIHMATFTKVEDFYNGDLANEATINRLEKLSEEFMDADFSSNSKDVQDAANSAKAQILSLSSKTDAFSKAAALNEFMAWTLSNDALAKELKERPTSVVSKISRTVKALMQRLMGGIPTDMFSNIAFNTDLLITGEGNGTGGNGGDGNDSGGLTPAAHNYTNFWIDLVKTRLENLNNTVTVGTQAARAQFNDYRAKAQKSVDGLMQGGFGLNAYQKENFKAIHTVLAMEMRLDTQSSIALNDIFEFVTDNLTPDMFGPTNEQDRYSTIMDLFGGTKNDEQVSDAIAVLLALSQTSEGFRRALDQLPTPPSESGVNTVSLNDFLGSVTGMLMNKAVGSIDTAEGSVKETLDALSESILHEESDREFRVLAGLMKNITKADEYLSGGFKKLAQFTEDRNVEVQAGNRSALTKIVSGSITAATAFLDEDKAKIQADALKRVTHMGTSLDRFVPVREFITEAIGTDGDNAELVALLDRTNFAQSGVRQNYREDLPIHLQNGFETHPDETQWKATHHVMGKTDFSTVFDPYNPDTSFRLISDEEFLDKKIAQSEAVLRSNFSASAFDDVTTKGQQLADYMVGKGAGHQLLSNAYMINKLSGGYTEGMTSELDQLISMYAIKGTPVADRLVLKEMYREDPEGLINLATYTQALNKEEDLKTITEDARMNGYKGYIPDHGAPGSKTVIADDDTRETLEKQGYKRVGDALADENFSLRSRGYYTTTTKQTGTYSQGVMQTVQDSYRGVNSITGLSVNGTTSGVIAGDSVNTITDELTDAGAVRDPKEVLIPRFAVDEETGEIGVLYYERAMNPDIIQKYQAPKSNMALMLGAWAGRQVEEKFAQKYNDELIIELKNQYDSREINDNGLFVNLPAEKAKLDEWNRASKAQRRLLKKPDPVFVDSWNVISPRTKEMIKEVFGEDMFYVRKDQMNLALGYRDPSIIDMWTGDTRVPEGIQQGVQALTASIMGKKAMKLMAGIEGGLQGVVSTAKDLIVVRSLVVPYMNTQANIFQLQTRGIPFKKMYKAYPNKLSEIEQYNKNAKKIIELETRIQLAGIDKNRVAILQQQIAVIEGQNQRFSIEPLIRAGAYKNISEGITDLDVDLSTGRIGEWVENQTNKLPAGVQTVAKYGLLSKDTALYKGANKAVQYGDFIAKAIYYDELTSKGMTHDDAMKLVNEEFVNFSVLPGRTRQYMEGIGATWFLTFKIRIMKIAMNQIRENPARSLITGFSGVDGPLGDNLATVIADDRIGYALGWEMLFGSAGLNPWLNVSDWN